MPASARTFWLAGLLAAGLVTLIVRFGLITRLAFVGSLLDRPGAPGVIAAIVLAVVIWIVLIAAIRVLGSRRELSVIREVGEVLRGGQRPTAASGADMLLVQRVGAYEGSMIRHRFELLGRRLDSAESNFAESTLAGQSGLDAAASETAYGPVRALVWSLPALGFLGTAAEMSRAVRGLGVTVAATASYSDLREFLVSRVIPPLADAFAITLFALGSSIVCYLLLTLAYGRDQQVLNEADRVSLEFLVRIGFPPSTNGRLTGDMDALRAEVAKSYDALTQSNRALEQVSAGGGIGQLVQILLSIEQRLGEIRERLGDDLVIQSIDQQLGEIRERLGEDLVIQRISSSGHVATPGGTEHGGRR